ncbi:MAG: HAMP domain-containing protein [Balneola sp.]|nr:HAMP domain-containing protein [Balneola sp.]MBO6652303.1 HAMP domain-containing protein [Balneola sp.]MBO6711455.1 HAMP domain-containing protein [Balneola sp.]MBO6801191.1 HAMP domain-containing protein [Balneola sp.]MBO6869391.1 HAMP domain-containing protein [Balneola sp.]
MTLERKIISSFIFLAVLLIGIGFVWEFYYTDINNEQFLESKNATAVVDYTNQMEVGLYQTLIYLNLIHETRTSREKIRDIRDVPLHSKSKSGYEKGIKAFYSSSEELQKIIADRPMLTEEVFELKQRVVLYESLSKDWLDMEEDLVTKSNVLFLSSIAPYFLNNIIPKFEEIRTMTIERQDLMINDLDEKLRRGRIINYFATFVILVIGVVIAMFLYRSIINPLQALSYSVKKVGEGDLDQRVEVGSKDEFSYVAKAFNTMAENLQEQTISSTYLDNLMESISEGIFVIDNNGILKRLNEAGVEMLELKKSELVGKPISAFFNLIEPKEASNETRKEEYQLQTIRDKKVPVLFSESALIEDGEKKGSVIVVRDISELKNAENEIKKSLEEKNVMLAEIHHRVKNNLAVVSGLLQLQIMQTKSEEVNKVLTESQLRVKSIALIHEKLYGSDSLAYIDYEKYIKDLVQNINSTYFSEKKTVNVKTHVKDVSLNVNQAIPCSLLINEVLVNAYKHAFTEAVEGEISIYITEREGRIEVEVTDSGKGLKEVKKGKKKINSLGFTLMKTLTGQLDGTYLFENREDQSGTIFKLSFKKEHR